MLGRNPEDFALFEIGTWDEQKGKILGYAQNKSIGLAVEYVQGGQHEERNN